jgi:hypothetical protein
MAISVCVTQQFIVIPVRNKRFCGRHIVRLGVCVAWHPVTFDFGNMQNKKKCAVGILLKTVSFNLVSWSLVANMNSFKHMLIYDNRFSVCLVGCFRETCRTLLHTCDVTVNNVQLPFEYTTFLLYWSLH